MTTSAVAVPLVPSRKRRLLAEFVLVELKCLLFPLAILGGLGITQHVSFFGLARYDTMLVYCLVLQAAMVRVGLETLSELRAVCVFHILGLVLELQRTSVGAWTYPDPGLLRIGPVPLFSGFMYAGVASYLLQAWRRFRLSFDRLPPLSIRAALAVAAYLSFFVLPGSRATMIALITAVYLQTKVSFDLLERRLWMPLGVAFAALGGVVWVGENAGTFLGAWRYPHQALAWHPVEATKAGAWFLLIVVGFTIVEAFKAWERRPSDAR